MEKNFIELCERINDGNSCEAEVNFAIGILVDLAYTINAPSNWRNLGSMLAEKYRDTKAYDRLQLEDFE